MPESATPPCLLVIDDDSDVCETIAEVLGGAFTVVQAHNGAAGIEMFLAHRPVAVVVDLRLPDIDGLDILSALSKDSPETPIIVITGKGGRKDAIGAIRRGAWDYLEKTLEFEELLPLALRRCMERASLLDERRRYLDHLESKVLQRTRDLSQSNEQLALALRERAVLKARLDEAARERQRLEGVIEKSPAVTFVWENSPGLPVLYVTRGVERFGRSQAEFRSGEASFPDMIPLLDREAFRAALDRVRGGGEQTLFHRLDTGGGEVLWVETRLFASVGENGVVDVLHGVVLDVTPGMRAQEAMRASEARYRALFEDCPVSLWELDLSALKRFVDDLRAGGVSDLGAYFRAHPEVVRRCAALIAVMDTNQSSVRVFGAMGKGALLSGLGGLFVAQTYRTLAEFVLAMTSGQRHFTAETEHRTLDGRNAVSTVQARVAAGHEESLSRVIVSFLDVSDRREAEDALAASIEFVSQVLGALPDPVFVKDAAHRFVLINDALCDFTGISREAFFGRTDRDLFPREYADRFWKVDEEVLTTGAPVMVEEPLAMRDGSVRYLSTKKAALRLPTTGETVLVGVIRDMTERRRMEKELVAARDNAEAADRAKSEFLANMSHELRTPMNAVIGMSELALETSLTAEQQDFLRTIRDSAKTLLRIVNDILDLSKIEARQLELVSIAFNLDLLVSAVVKALSVEADRKGLRVAVLMDDAVPRRLKGDSGRLRQILVNLVGNAIKFTDQGSVTVRVGLEKGAAAMNGDVFLRFEVSDTGPGIAPERREAIFERFTQGDGSITRRHGGTGLGLAISKRLVTLMGGEIGVGGGPGEGSTFFFTARFEADEEVEAPGGQEGREDGEPQGLNILVAEDNPVNQRLLTTHLERQGHFPVVAGNGQEALDMLASRCFDVVLMDVRMPGMDGLQTVRRIRTADPGRINPGIAVIAMSAQAMKGDRERFLEAGMDDYLSKPVDFSRLREALRAATSRRMRCAAKPLQADAGHDAARVFDRQEALERLGGDEQFLWELIEVFSADAPARLTELEAAVQAGDAAASREIAHSIKGGATAVGAVAVQGMAQAIEDAAAAGETASMQENLARLRFELSRALEVLGEEAPGR